MLKVFHNLTQITRIGALPSLPNLHAPLSTRQVGLLTGLHMCHITLPIKLSHRMSFRFKSYFFHEALAEALPKMYNGTCLIYTSLWSSPSLAIY